MLPWRFVCEPQIVKPFLVFAEELGDSLLAAPVILVLGIQAMGGTFETIAQRATADRILSLVLRAAGSSYNTMRCVAAKCLRYVTSNSWLAGRVYVSFADAILGTEAQWSRLSSSEQNAMIQRPLNTAVPIQLLEPTVFGGMPAPLLFSE